MAHHYSPPPTTLRLPSPSVGRGWGWGWRAPAPTIAHPVGRASDRLPRRTQGHALPRAGAPTVDGGALWCHPSHRRSPRDTSKRPPGGREGAARRRKRLDSGPRGALNDAGGLRLLVGCATAHGPPVVSFATRGQPSPDLSQRLDGSEIRTAQTQRPRMVALIPPEFLYRYRSTNNEYFAEELRRAVDKKQVYFSDLLSVNDPFEARPYLQSNTIREVRAYLAKFEERFGKGVAITGTNFGELAKHAGIRKSKVRDAVGPSLKSATRTISSIEKTIDFLRSQLKVACFSEKWDSLLMWGHYGLSHRGVCIEYATNIETAARVRLAPVSVVYSEVRPIVTYIELMEHTALANNQNNSDFFDLDRARRTFDSLAMTKPKEWAYEQEWRVMKVGDDPVGYHTVVCLEPTAILLGAQHTKETLFTVREVVGEKIPIETVSLDPQNFALRRRPL
jgi:Protein of unknown function (DUF2971)